MKIRFHVSSFGLKTQKSFKQFEDSSEVCPTGNNCVDRQREEEDRGRRTEGRGQREEDRRIRTEGGGQREEDTRIRTEGGGQKEEERGRRTEGGGQHSGTVRVYCPSPERNDLFGFQSSQTSQTFTLRNL